MREKLELANGASKAAAGHGGGCDGFREVTACHQRNSIRANRDGAALSGKQHRDNYAAPTDSTCANSSIRHYERDMRAEELCGAGRGMQYGSLRKNTWRRTLPTKQRVAESTAGN